MPIHIWFMLVGTLSAFGPEIAYRLRVAQLMYTFTDIPIYFDLLLYYYKYVSVPHLMTAPLWLAVGPQSL